MPMNVLAYQKIPDLLDAFKKGQDITSKLINMPKEAAESVAQKAHAEADKQMMKGFMDQVAAIRKSGIPVDQQNAQISQLAGKMGIGQNAQGGYTEPWRFWGPYYQQNPGELTSTPPSANPPTPPTPAKTTVVTPHPAKIAPKQDNRSESDKALDDQSFGHGKTSMLDGTNNNLAALNLPPAQFDNRGYQPVGYPQFGNADVLNYNLTGGVQPAPILA